MSKSKLLELERGTAQPKEAAAPELPPFVPPAVALGQCVCWYADRHKSGRSLGFVVGTHDNGLIDVNITMPNEYGWRPYTGVRHADDPNKEAIDGAGEGCWEHTEETKQANEMMVLLIETVDMLRREQQTMAKQIAGLKGKKDGKGSEPAVAE